MSQLAESTDTAAIKSANAKYQWHPMTAPKASELDPPVIIERGHGVHVTDIDGRTYLDCTAGLWNVNVGHNRPEVNKAITEQLSKIAYYSCFVGTSNPPSIELSAKLIGLLQTENAAKVLFCSGGSDATETSFKLARQYWKLKGQPSKVKIISLKDAYHGLHFGGMSACGINIYRLAYGPAVPDFHQVENPALYRNRWTKDPQELGEICARELEREMQYHGQDTVAAFIAEPIQGAGGVWVPPANYWPLVREVCDRNNVLLISDEVVTGFGRSGAFLGCRGWGVKPDIMCFAKGISSAYVPLGATVVNERVAEAWKNNPDTPVAMIMHGYTYSGHPVACAAGVASLDITVREDLPSNASKQGAYLLGRLQKELMGFPSVGDVRGKGLMICVEMVTDKKSAEAYPSGHPFPTSIYQHCKNHHVLVRLLAHKIILSPPLIFSKQHCDTVADALRNAFAELDKN
jgi:adenosylmethionine-8-amino-7-oxononanoate aminotransferase